MQIRLTQATTTTLSPGPGELRIQVVTSRRVYRSSPFRMLPAPVITCPADVTIDCEDDSTPTGTGTATATDNCAAVGNIAITFTDVSTQNADPANAGHYNYTITRTWRATDPTGNFTTCVQVITVQDVTAPVITCPADITIDCEDDSTPTGTGTATATDNCAAVGNIPSRSLM